MGNRALARSRERRAAQNVAAQRLKERTAERCAALADAVSAGGADGTLVARDLRVAHVDLRGLLDVASVQLERDGKALTKADLVQTLFVVTVLCAQRDGGSVPATFHAEMQRLTVDALRRLLRARLYDPETLAIRVEAKVGARAEAGERVGAKS